ncbi:MAK10-like protein [Tanacetum coccineum]
MIGKINLLWKTVSEKLNNVSTSENARNTMAPKSIAAISHDEREELRKNGIKIPSKLLSLKYLSPASIKELNKNPSAPKRVHFVNSIVILSTDRDTEEEDDSSTNACDLNLGGMVKGKEGVKEQGKEENEMEADMEIRGSKPFDTLADLGSCVNITPLYLFKKLNIGLLEETGHIFGLADRTKSYPVGIVKDVEVHIGKLKLLNEFYVIDMKKYPETPLLVGRGFLATANAVIDCRMAKIAVGEGITSKRLLRCLGRRMRNFRDAELNLFKDTLLLGELWILGAIPINLKCNMWESEELIKKLINWDKPPKNGDGAWHAKIRLIDPDGEEFTKTLQSIPTTGKALRKRKVQENHRPWTTFITSPLR